MSAVNSVWDWRGPVVASLPQPHVRPAKARHRPASEPVKNPWGITATEAQAIDHLIEHGSFKAASAATGITRKAYESRAWNARKRMGSPKGDYVRYAVQWALWRQTEGQGVPA